MPIKEMDPELVRRAVEGYQDELTPARKVRDAFYRSFRCPRCHIELTPEYDSRVCFTPDDLVPRALLRCPECSYLIDPHTRLVVETGRSLVGH